MNRLDFSADLAQVLQALPPPRETTTPPRLIMMVGLPGTGKSFLARKLAERLPAVLVESDFVRKTLFPQPTYTAQESTWVHRIAHAALEHLLRSGHSAVYDATNLSEWHRGKVYRLAERAGGKLVIVQTVAPEPVIHKRLNERQKARTPQDLSDATLQVYERLRRRVEPIRRPHLTVDTTRDLRRSIARILRAARR